jgi:predicted RNA-binding Zn-ribbon protein involved in translation (DUF1610 family)
MTDKRKYARMGETSIKDECTNQECMWQGSDNEKGNKRINAYQEEYICPKCGNNEFYRLLS